MQQQFLYICIDVGLSINAEIIFLCVYVMCGGCGPVHKPFAYHAKGLRSFPGEDNATPQTAEQTANKGCTNVCIKSVTSKWTFVNHKASCQDDWFTSQSPTPMVAHGKLTSSNKSLKLIHVKRCWAKPLIPYRLCPPSNDRYLVEWKLEKLWTALAIENALNSPQRRWDRIRENSNTRGVNCSLLNSRGFQTINLYIYLFTFICCLFAHSNCH